MIRTSFANLLSAVFLRRRIFYEEDFWHQEGGILETFVGHSEA
jgi:hypothetical protein